jgi:hypothetical protein
VITADQLLDLLPAVYARRDTEAPQDGYLRSLLTVLAEQAGLVEEDLARLYDGWFIETCDPWLVSYIADLLGVRPLHPVGTVASVPRAYVANTLAFRRRKGTPAVLEQLARDVTGWPASVAELFTRVAWTQNVNHVRPGVLRTPDLRRSGELEWMAGPFDRVHRSVDVRGAAPDRPNIPDVALSVWRHEPFRVTGVVPVAAADPVDGRYIVDPTGREVPLANAPLPEESITSLATQRHLPGLLGRRELFDLFEDRRGSPAVSPRQPPIRIAVDTGSGLEPVDPAVITAADLSDPVTSVTTGWRRPAAPLLVAVDPVLGRLAFREGVLPDRVEIAYTYLAAGRVGAGPYDRASRATADLLDRATFVRAVGTRLPARPELNRSSLLEALQDWGSPPPGTVGVITVLDDRTYAGPLAVTVPAGCTLLLTSGMWPDAETEATVGEAADLANLRLDERRPVVAGGLTVTGGTTTGSAPQRGRIVVDGLVVDDTVTVAEGDLGELVLSHTTLPPRPTGPSLSVAEGNTDLTVVVQRCITGGVALAGEGPRLRLSSTVVDGAAGVALDARGADVSLDAVTVLGDLLARMLEASDCLFDGRVTVARTQQGCLRYSYLRDGVTPRRYRCQPDLALSAPGLSDPGAVRARLTPQLQSRRFGEPGYAALADRSAEELRTGSSGFSDMGVFGSVLRPQRESNLRTALEEYLPAGRRAGIHHAT